MKQRIEIAGPLASGKTALARLISAEPSSEGFAFVYENLKPIREQREFWVANQRVHSFFMQCVFYRHRYQQLSDLEYTCGNGVFISDFSLFVDHYAYSSIMRQMGLLTALEFQELEHLMMLYASLLPSVAGIIYCYCPADTLYARVKARRRAEESGVTQEFLHLLVTECDNWVKSVSMPILKIELFGSAPHLAKTVHDFVSSVT